MIIQKNRETFGDDFIFHFFLKGMNVGHKKRKPGRLGCKHRLNKDDAMKWFQTKYDGIILNKGK